jgi:hydrogenase expression/formation protein HypC
MCLAVPGKVLNIAGEGVLRTGRVSFGGVVKEVNLAYVPQAEVGSYVLVHAGFAISVVDESAAVETLGYLRRLGAAPVGE